MSAQSLLKLRPPAEAGSPGGRGGGVPFDMVPSGTVRL